MWEGDIDQVLKYIWEVAFFHRSSRTLVLVDLVENIGDETDGVGWGLKLWWKDKNAAKRSLEQILQWDFERVLLAHGDFIETNAKATLREAWKIPLKG